MRETSAVDRGSAESPESPVTSPLAADGAGMPADEELARADATAEAAPPSGGAAGAGLHDRRARRIGPARAVGLHAEFGDDHRVRTPRPERLAEDALRLAALLAVHRRGIEQRDAEVQRPVDDAAGDVRVDGPAEVVAAEADGGYLQA